MVLHRPSNLVDRVSKTRSCTVPPTLVALLLFTLGLMPAFWPGVARALAGVEGTFEYGFDAPWRIEPSTNAQGVTEYGAIPIQMSVLDAELNFLDAWDGTTLGDICSIKVTEQTSNGPVISSYTAADLEDIEMSGRWISPASTVVPFVCRPSQGEDCTALEYLGGSAEWHAVLWHDFDASFGPGDVVPMTIEMVVSKGDIEPGHDPAVPCASAGPDELIRMTNSVRVTLAPEPLPRFGSGWLYGDLHYHSQGTDNEGEAGYHYRGVVRAMGSMGLDFAFATEHASDGQQFIDLDATTEVSVDDGLFEWALSIATGLPLMMIDGDPTITAGSAYLEFGYANALRDMSANRFSFLNGHLNGSSGINHVEPFQPRDGRLLQNVESYGVAPQIFLGGEVDVIPEVEPGSWDAAVEYGNGLTSPEDGPCGGWNRKLEPILYGDECDIEGLLEQTPTGTLVGDVQALNEVHYGRMHLVHLPRQPLPNHFVASDTSIWGGANRRLDEPHVGEDGVLRPGVLSEIESNGDYAFIAHPLNGANGGGEGPNGIPWSEHMLEKAWKSPSILGLQLWNEDTRLTHEIQPWKAELVTAPDGAPPPPGGECVPWTSDDQLCIRPVPGDDPSLGKDIGYERLDCEEDGSGRLGLDCSYRFIPHASRRAGLESGEYELQSSAAEEGFWGAYELSWHPESSVEHKLHHGAAMWDQINHWGLDVKRTAQVPWLPPGEPRRFFMAGGSDAHGDLNYRRSGYLLGTDALSDTAIGKPRNLVQVPLQADTGPNGEAIYWQQDIVDSLIDGRFSVTDGPALRIFVDYDQDCVQDYGEPSMGSVHAFAGTRKLPLCVEWLSTAEFGAVEQVDLYVGARSSTHDQAQASPTSGRTYAPLFAGPRSVTTPERGYAGDPDGTLRLSIAKGGEMTGKRAFELDLSHYPADDGAGGDIPADRFFVRAVATTRMADEALCLQGHQQRGECIRRYAFTNPIWAIETGPDYVFLEAENGLPDKAPGDTFELRYPMQVATDIEASGDQYIWVPEGTSTAGNSALYYFRVETSGEYALFGREVSNDGNSDSLYVTMQEFGGGFVTPRNGDIRTYWPTKHGGGVDQWVWDRARKYGQGAPLYYALSPGKLYMLKIEARENGTKLDRLVLTNDPGFDPEGFFEAPRHPSASGAPRIDWCLHTGRDCGAPAAHAYCEMTNGPGFVATDFAKADDIGSASSPTFILGETDPTRQLCSGSYCDGFAFIRCEDTRKTIATPMSAGYRIDWCLNWGTNCGEPAATRACLIYEGGNHRAVDHAVAPNVGPTFVLGDARVCADPGCDGFAWVECAADPPSTEIAFDADFDGVDDHWDNCPDDPNPMQENIDGDLFGDACDPAPLVPIECNDGLDNDGDGLADAADPGCDSTTDSYERSDALVCDDGFDNDGDGLTDYPADPQCKTILAATEATECGDGLDNDGDGLADRIDPDCNGPDDESEWHLTPGDVVVADWDGRVIRVEPISGAQQVLYAGTPLRMPAGVATTQAGDVLVSDAGSAAVFRIHHDDGRISTVTAGGNLSVPRRLTLDPQGRALVCDQGGSVVRVDVDSGSQTMLNSPTAIAFCEGVAVNDAGAIAVADRTGSQIVLVDAASGSTTALQPGGSFVMPTGIVFEDADHLVVADSGANQLDRVDLTTETRAPISKGQLFSAMRGTAIGRLGEIYVADIDAGVILVDPTLPADSNQQSITADLGTLTGITVHQSAPACRDGIDDDGDGLVDMDDGDCQDGDDDAEYHLDTDDIVAVDGMGRIVRIDPRDGRQTRLLSTGLIGGAFGVAVDPARDIVFTHEAGSRVMRLDTDRGALEVVSAGDLLSRPREIQVEADGTLLVTDAGTQSIVSIDPASGAQTLVADDAGDRFQSPEGLAIAPDGRLIVSDWQGIPEILAIDRQSPDAHTIVSQASAFERPRRIRVGKDGDLFVVDSGASNEIFRVDLATGAILATITSDGLLVDGYGLDEETDGHLLVASRSPGRIVRVHPETGNQILVSSGDALQDVNGLAVVKPRCSDGFDNDGDGSIDAADRECSSVSDDSEDLRCGLGYDLVLTLPLIMTLRRCVRRKRRSG